MTLTLTLYSARRPPQEALVSGLPSHSLPYEFSSLLPGVTANLAADAVQAFVTSAPPHSHTAHVLMLLCHRAGQALQVPGLTFSRGREQRHRMATLQGKM